MWREGMEERKELFFPGGGFILENLNPPRHVNVIVVMLDSLRRDHVGCYGNRAKTLNLDGFAKEAAIFEEAYTASFPTLPNRTDHFTGRYTFPLHDWSPLPADESVLAETVGHHGIISMLIGDTYHMFKDNYFFTRGFAGWYWNRGQEGDRLTTDADIPIVYPCAKEKIRWWERGRYENIIRNRYYRRVETDWFAPGTITKAMQWLEHNYKHKSFLLWIDLFDPHEPWDPPQYYIDMYDPDYSLEEDCDYPVYGPANRFSERELQHTRARYAAEVTMVDRWFGRLLEKIDDLRLTEKTMVMFTSDHGHYLGYPGDDGLIGKPIGPKGLMDSLIHIPLLVRMPDGTAAGKRIKGIVQPVDTMPAILEFFGIPKPKECHGQSYLPLIKGEMHHRKEYALSGRNNRVTHLSNSKWSYGCFQKGLEWRKAVLFDLEKDPFQQNNIIEQEKGIAKELHEKLIQFLKSINVPESQQHGYKPV